MLVILVAQFRVFWLGSLRSTLYSAFHEHRLLEARMLCPNFCSFFVCRSWLSFVPFLVGDFDHRRGQTLKAMASKTQHLALRTTFSWASVSPFSTPWAKSYMLRGLRGWQELDDIWSPAEQVFFNFFESPSNPVQQPLKLTLEVKR